MHHTTPRTTTFDDVVSIDDEGVCFSIDIYVTASAILPPPIVTTSFTVVPPSLFNNQMSVSAIANNTEARQAASTLSRHLHEALTGLDHGGKANGALSKRLPALIGEGSLEGTAEAKEVAMRASKVAHSARGFLISSDARSSSSSPSSLGKTPLERHGEVVGSCCDEVKDVVDVLNLTYMKLMGGGS